LLPQRVGCAAADALWAGTLLLRAACMGIDHDPQAAPTVAEAGDLLEQASEQVEGIFDAAAELGRLLDIIDRIR
jgi:hypothetical protein